MMAVTWGDPHTVTVAQLKAGDFVEYIPAQSRIRAYTVQSGIAVIGDPEFGHYTYGPPRRKVPVQSRRVAFKDPGIAAIHLPLTHEVIARVMTVAS